MWSRVLDLACGFCNIREGRVIAALNAMASRSDSVAKLLKSRVSSVTNCLPHAPDGILKRLGLQCTTSAYASSIIFEKSTPDTPPQDEVMLGAGLNGGTDGGLRVCP